MSSANPFSKFLPSSSAKPIQKKMVFKKQNHNSITNNKAKKGNSGTWLNTKKRGRDDDVIETSKKEAEKNRKESLVQRNKRQKKESLQKLAKNKRAQKKRHNVSISSDEDESETESIKDFIAEDDESVEHEDEDYNENIEIKEFSSDDENEEDISDSFMPTSNKPRCQVKKVTTTMLHNIQVKKNRPQVKKTTRTRNSTRATKKKNDFSFKSDALLSNHKAFSRKASSTTDIYDSETDVKENYNSKVKPIFTRISNSRSTNKPQRLNLSIESSEDENLTIPIFSKKHENDAPEATLKESQASSNGAKQESSSSHHVSLKIARVSSSDDEEVFGTNSNIITLSSSPLNSNHTDLLETDDEKDEIPNKETTNSAPNEPKAIKTRRLKKMNNAVDVAKSEKEGKIVQLSSSDEMEKVLIDLEQQDEDDGVESEEEFFDKEQQEAGNVLKAANKLSDQIIKKMQQWCMGSSNSFILNGAIKANKVSSTETYMVKKSDLEKILSSSIKLPDYQMIGVNWMALLDTMTYDVGRKKTNINGILADEMGLGKTIQTISFLAWLRFKKKRIRPNIVIVPASVLNNWENEFKKVCPELAVIKYHGSLDDRYLLREELRTLLHNPNGSKKMDILLTTFSYFSGEKAEDRNFLRKFNFDYMVVDEAHCLKNPKSSRYRNMDKFVTDHKLLLTGTPVQNSPEELMSLLCFLMPLFKRNGSSYDDDDDKNDGGARMLQHFVTLKGGQDNEDYKKLKQLFSPFVLRRIKDECLNQILPPKIHKLEIVPIKGYVRTLYDSCISDHIESKKGVNNGNQAAFNHLFTQLRKAANHPLLLRHRHKSSASLNKIAELLHSSGYFGNQCSIKQVKQELEAFSDYDIHCAALTVQEEKPHLESQTSPYILTPEDLLVSPKFMLLQKLLPDLISDSHRILIFSQWTRCLDLLGHLMEHLDISFMRLDGQTEVNERQKMIDEFTNDTSIKVFLLSTRAGGLGINLTSADTCIMHDLDFNPFNDLQAEARCHRMGQKKPVTIYKLVTEDTVETDIHYMQEKKAKMNAAILEDKSSKKKKQEQEQEVNTILKSAMDRYLDSKKEDVV